MKTEQTKRAQQAISAHRAAVAACNLADEHAGRIGPKVLQTEDTMPRYDNAQAMLAQAEALLVATRLALAEIPSDELSY